MWLLFLDILEGKEASEFLIKFGKKLFNTTDIAKASKAIKSLKSKGIYSNIKKLAPKELKQLIKEVSQYQERTNRKKDLFINDFNTEKELSSSFVEYGIFHPHKNNEVMGTLIISIDGKEYATPNVKTSIWLAMVSATGMNGTGAGSVLWNTIWYYKRTTSKITGGVYGKKEDLQKARKIVNLTVARHQKRLNALFNTPTLAQRQSKQLKQRIQKNAVNRSLQRYNKILKRLKG